MTTILSSPITTGVLAILIVVGATALVMIGLREAAEPQFYPHEPFDPRTRYDTHAVRVVPTAQPFDWAVECVGIGECGDLRFADEDEET